MYIVIQTTCKCTDTKCLKKKLKSKYASPLKVQTLVFHVEDLVVELLQSQ